jgi:hypothetical protein
VTSRERAVLRLFFAVGVPLFAAAYGARPLLRARAERLDQLAQSRDFLARAQVALRDDARTQRDLDSLRLRERQAMRAVVTTAGQATAISHVTEQLRTLARRHDVLVLSTNELASDSTLAGLSLMRIGVRVESDLRGVARLLNAIENDGAALRVSRIFFERRSAEIGTAAGDSLANVLTAHLTVESLARVSAPTGGPR